MNLLVEKKYSGAVEVFKQNIALLEIDQEKATGAEASLMHSTLDNVISVLHCNCAIAEYEMGLYRKCIKSCDMALKHDPTNLNAYYLEGKAYLSMGKKGHAQAIWHEGCDKITDFSDAGIALSLLESLTSLKKGSKESVVRVPSPLSPSEPPPVYGTSSGSIGTSMSADKNIAGVTSSVKCLTSSSPLSNKQPPLPPPPPTITSTSMVPRISPKPPGGAADAIAALGGKDRKVGIEQLQIIENHFIGFRPNQIHPDVIKAASRSVANACGENTVDNLISMGYLLVNNNKLSEACELFTTLLQYRLDLLAAYLGLGSCWAMTGRMQEAVQAFSSAIALDPQCVDAWKRRGQTLAAIDHVDEGLADLQHALTLGDGDNDIYFHVGSTLHQKKHFQAALDALHTFQQNGGANSGKLFNLLGMCHSQLGDVDQALEYFNQAICLDHSLIESTINCAQILKEAGRGDEADMAFENVTRWYNVNRPTESSESSTCGGKVDMFRQVLQYRATLQYSLGNYMEALGYLRRYLGDEYDSLEDPLKKTDRVNALVQSALCLQNLGHYSEALIFFDNALQLLPNSTCIVQKQLLMYYLRQIDYSCDEFCVDLDFNAQWKEAFCKYNAVVIHHQAPFVIRTYNVDDEDDITDELNPSYDVGPELKSIVEISRGLSHWIQLDSPGFLLNSRQHKAFGLATLQMAKKLSQHCDLIITQCDEQIFASSSSPPKPDNKAPSGGSGGGGLQVLNCGASGGSTDEGGTHTFMFRDFFDVAVKWRQVSEPNDPVWWIDRLTKKSFEDGFGLHTPMVNGELKCIRYYPYFDMGFALLKKLLVEQDYFVAKGEQRCILLEPKKVLVSSATTLDDIYAAVGEDFWVVCPCRSSIQDKELLEGTRLTLVKKTETGTGGSGSDTGVGYDFSIRSPGLPARWEAMEAELTACFNSIVKQLLLLKRMDNIDHMTPSSCNIRETTQSQLMREALRLFFYWVNFAPLTRGSAMCGYAAIMAVIVASNRTIKNSIPKGKQLDWEAIFTADSNDFIDKFEGALHTEPSHFSLTNDVDFETAMPSLYDALHALQLA